MGSTRKLAVARAAVVLALVAGIAIAALPNERSTAAGRYACDAVWIGPRTGGEWHEPGNWSGGRTPGAEERACVARSHTVVVSRGPQRVGSIEIGGRLTVVSGSLELSDTRVPSEADELVLSHGRLDVGGRLEIAGFFYWGAAGHMSGGEIRLGVASNAELVGGHGATLPKWRGDEGASPPYVRTEEQTDESPPCGPYSPRASRACGSRDRASIARVRAIWSRFVNGLNASAPADELAKAVAPLACVPEGEQVPSSARARRDYCRHAVEMLRAAIAAGKPIDRDLHNVLVVRDRAFGNVAGRGGAQFARTSRGWLITKL